MEKKRTAPSTPAGPAEPDLKRGPVTLGPSDWASPASQENYYAEYGISIASHPLESFESCYYTRDDQYTGPLNEIKKIVDKEYTGSSAEVRQMIYDDVVFLFMTGTDGEAGAGLSVMPEANAISAQLNEFMDSPRPNKYRIYDRNDESAMTDEPAAESAEEPDLRQLRYERAIAQPRAPRSRPAERWPPENPYVRVEVGVSTGLGGQLGTQEPLKEFNAGETEEGLTIDLTDNQYQEALNLLLEIYSEEFLEEFLTMNFHQPVSVLASANLPELKQVVRLAHDSMKARKSTAPLAMSEEGGGGTHKLTIRKKSNRKKIKARRKRLTTKSSRGRKKRLSKRSSKSKQTPKKRRSLKKTPKKRPKSKIVIQKGGWLFAATLTFLVALLIMNAVEFGDPSRPPLPPRPRTTTLWGTHDIPGENVDMEQKLIAAYMAHTPMFCMIMPREGPEQYLGTGFFENVWFLSHSQIKLFLRCKVTGDNEILYEKTRREGDACYGFGPLVARPLGEEFGVIFDDESINLFTGGIYKIDYMPGSVAEEYLGHGDYDSGLADCGSLQWNVHHPACRMYSRGWDTWVNAPSREDDPGLYWDPFNLMSPADQLADDRIAKAFRFLKSNGGVNGPGTYNDAPRGELYTYFIRQEVGAMKVKLDEGFSVADVTDRTIILSGVNTLYRGVRRELPFIVEDGELVFYEKGYLSTTTDKHKALEFACKLDERNCDGGVIYVIMDIVSGLPYIDLIGTTMTHWTGNRDEKERIFRKPKLTEIARTRPRGRRLYVNQNWADSWENDKDTVGSSVADIIDVMEGIEREIRTRESDVKKIRFPYEPTRITGPPVSIIFVKMTDADDPADDFERRKARVRAKCPVVYKYKARAQDIRPATAPARQLVQNPRPTDALNPMYRHAVLLSDPQYHSSH